MRTPQCVIYSLIFDVCSPERVGRRPGAPLLWIGWIMMRTTHRLPMFAVSLVAATLLGAIASLASLASPAYAQETPAPSAPKEIDLDQGLEPTDGAVTREVSLDPIVPAFVDRREEIDPLAAQDVLFATAHTYEAGSVVLRSHLFVAGQVDVAITDRVMVGAHFAIAPQTLGFDGFSPAYDDFVGGQIKAALLKGRDVTLSLQPAFTWRQGSQELDTSEGLAALALLVDWIPDDRFVLTFGLTAGAPLWYTYDEENESECMRRDEFFEGTCIFSEEATESMPSGGRFLLAHVGMSMIAHEHWIIKGEVFSALRQGAILGIDNSLRNEDDIARQRAQFNDPDLAIGPVEGAALGASLGAQWVYGGFGVQSALVFLPSERIVDRGRLFLPMLTLGYKI